MIFEQEELKDFLLHNWMWKEKRVFSKAEAWVDIFFMVQETDEKVLIDGKVIIVTAGSIATTQKELAERWNWSRKKVTFFLENLQKNNLLSFESTNRYTKIIIKRKKDKEREHEVEARLGHALGNDQGTLRARFREQKRTSENELQTVGVSDVFETKEEGKNIKRTSKEHQKNIKRTSEEHQKNIKNEEKGSEKENGAIVEKNAKTQKHKYGLYNNVLFNDEDMAKLKSEFSSDWQIRIEKLSEYMASTGKTYKNHLATIRSWSRKEKQNYSFQKTNNGQKVISNDLQSILDNMGAERGFDEF